MKGNVDFFFFLAKMPKEFLFILFFFFLQHYIWEVCPYLLTWKNVHNLLLNDKKQIYLFFLFFYNLPI